VTQNKLLYIRWPIASEVNIKNSKHNILYITQGIEDWLLLRLVCLDKSWTCLSSCRPHATI